MQKGFNHNVRYRGRVFHVQTEDSGERNPFISTHLFDGGDILASRKIEYRTILGKPMFERQVLRMMEDQHKTIVRDLVNGALDGLIQAHDRAVGTAAPTAPVRPKADGPAADPGATKMRPASRTTLSEYMNSEKTLDELVVRYLLEMERGS